MWPPTPQHSIVLPGFLSFSDTTSHRKIGHTRCAVSLTLCSLSSHRRGVFAQYQGRPRIPESQIALFSVMRPSFSGHRARTASKDRKAERDRLEQ